VCCVAVHLLFFAALFWPPQVMPARPRAMPMPIIVSLIDGAKPPNPPSEMKDLRAIARIAAFQPTTLQIDAPVVTIAADTPAPDTSDELSASQLAGATSAGENGQGGSGCNTAALVQRALRRDPRVRTAVADAHRLGKAVLLWNGNWVRTGEQVGKGLSAVREVIMWEVAFAPAACRNRREHGLILLSLADGSTRFAIGATDWRWSDLLGVPVSRRR
jgi:hypothetical protein